MEGMSAVPEVAGGSLAPRHGILQLRVLLVSPEPFPKYHGHSELRVERDLGKYRLLLQEVLL